MKKVDRKKITYLVFLIFNSILFCTSLVLITNHINIEKRKEKSFISTYTETSKINYHVNMIENDYISTDEFGHSNSYIMKYTKNLLLDFIYNFNATEDVNVEAEYKIIANVVGKYKQSSNKEEEIYNKEYILNNGNINSLNNQINFNKNTLIDINKYNEELIKLKNDIKVPLTGELNIYFLVTTKEEGKLINEYKQQVSISLLKDIYEIKIEQLQPVNNEIYSDDLKINYTYVMLLSLSLIIFTIIGLILIRLILRKKMTEAKKTVNKHLKVYDDFIVNINDKIEEDKYNVVKISEFKEILTLANNNFTSILYYEDKKTATFYVIINDNLYKLEINLR